MATSGPNSAQDEIIPSNPTPPTVKTSRRAGQRASQKGPQVGRIILLSGPPGAGKSTVAKELIATATAPTVYIEGDIFWSFIAKPHSPPKPRQATSRMVIKSMMLSALPYARAGYETIVDFTIGPWFLGLFKEYIKEIPFEYVILCPSEKVCVERNIGRKEGVMEEYPRDLHLAFSDINEFEKYAIRNDEASAKDLAVQIWDGLAKDVFKFDMKDLKDAS